MNRTEKKQHNNIQNLQLLSEWSWNLVTLQQFCNLADLVVLRRTGIHHAVLDFVTAFRTPPLQAIVGISSVEKNQQGHISRLHAVLCVNDIPAQSILNFTVSTPAEDLIILDDFNIGDVSTSWINFLHHNWRFSHTEQTPESRTVRKLNNQISAYLQAVQNNPHEIWQYSIGSYTPISFVYSNIDQSYGVTLHTRTQKKFIPFVNSQLDLTTIFQDCNLIEFLDTIETENYLQLEPNKPTGLDLPF